MTSDRWFDRMGRRLSSAVAILGSLIGVVASPALGKPATNDKLQTRMTRMGSWYIIYGRTLPPYQMTMLVVADEGCLLTIENVLGDSPPERPEIGSLEIHGAAPHGH